MPKQGPLESPNPLYAFETDPQRIQEVATLVSGMLGNAYNTRHAICEDGLGALQSTLDSVEDLDFGNPSERIGVLSRSILLQSIQIDDLETDVKTYRVRIKEQIATPDLEGPLSIHSIVIVCPHKDSNESFSIRHSYEFPDFDAEELIKQNGHFNKPFGTRIKNSFMDSAQMTIYEVNNMMHILQDVRYDAPQ